MAPDPIGIGMVQILRDDQAMLSRQWAGWQDVVVLDGLGRVDWARLAHAYGSAADVPGQIRALRSSEADQRADARDQLYGNIFHQGTRYEATAYAVPFLLEVLAAPDTADRAWLLELLASIAIGYDDAWLPAGLPIAEHRHVAVGGEVLLAAGPHPGDDDFDEDEGDFAYLESLLDDELDRLAAYVAVAAYDAVGVGVPLFRELLTDPDPVVRIWAAYALAWFPEEASPSLSSLAAVTSRDLAGPDDGAVAATETVAIGLLGGQPNAAALGDPRPLVRWGAAIALANVEGPHASPAVVDELLTCAGGSIGAGSGVPYLNGDLAGYAALALRQVVERPADATFDTLLAHIPSASGSHAILVVGEALRMAFPTGALPPGTRYATLDDRQRRLIDALVQSPATWLIDGVNFHHFSALVRKYGLPDNRNALQDYLETP